MRTILRSESFLGFLAFGALILATFVMWARGATLTSPGMSTPNYGVVEELVAVTSTETTLLVPTGNAGFFIQPQSSGSYIRVARGEDSTMTSSNGGVVVQYLEGLSEDYNGGQPYHSVRAIASSGTNNVWVSYYRR